MLFFDFFKKLFAALFPRQTGAFSRRRRRRRAGIAFCPTGIFWAGRHTRNVYPAHLVHSPHKVKIPNLKFEIPHPPVV